MMNEQTVLSHKRRNQLQTLLMLGGLFALLAVSSWLLFGPELWLWPLLALAAVIMTVPNASPYWLLRMHRARPLSAWQGPRLYQRLNQFVRVLGQRAQLTVIPELFVVPSASLNAFAVGSRHQPAIAVSQGLLTTLNEREISAVLAHEISHIRNNDLHTLTLAALITHFTALLSLLTVCIVLMLLPFMLLGLVQLSWSGLGLLLISPLLSLLMQSALSRLREFDADLDAARLTGDPVALASALTKIERRSQAGMQRWLAHWLGSHPDTPRRVQRLLQLHSVSQSPAVQPTALGQWPTHTPTVGSRQIKSHRQFAWQDTLGRLTM